VTIAEHAFRNQERRVEWTAGTHRRDGKLLGPTARVSGDLHLQVEWREIRAPLWRGIDSQHSPPAGWYDIPSERWPGTAWRMCVPARRNTNPRTAPYTGWKGFPDRFGSGSAGTAGATSRLRFDRLRIHRTLWRALGVTRQFLDPENRSGSNWPVILYRERSVEHHAGRHRGGVSDP
jgi:hypothetical protein